MRTIIDLPEDIYRLATSMARDKQQTPSRAAVDLVRRPVIALLTSEHVLVPARAS